MNTTEYDSLMTTFADQSSDIALMAGLVIMSVYMALLAIMVIILVFTIIANWKIFTKAGEAGWKSLIPIYSSVIQNSWNITMAYIVIFIGLGASYWTIDIIRSYNLSND